VSFDDKYVASGSYDTTVQIWSLINHTHIHTLHGHSQAVFTVAFSPNSEIVASASFDQSVQLSDVRSGSILKILKQNVSEMPAYLPLNHHIHFSSNQEFIVIGSHAMSIELTLPNSKPLNIVDQQQFPSYYIKAGWIVSFKNQQRICWIPQAYRALLVSTINGVALSGQTGQVIVLDFSKMNLPE
jgi:WD40 repeat protein